MTDFQFRMAASLVAVLTVAGVFGAGWATAALQARGELKAARAQWELKQERDARTKEATILKEVEEIRHARQQAFDRTAAELRAALDGLRQRPVRLPAAARPACEGATGRELSRPDAEFLARLAARADAVAAERDACYAAYEAAQRQLKQ